MIYTSEGESKKQNTETAQVILQPWSYTPGAGKDLWTDLEIDLVLIHSDEFGGFYGYL